MTHKLNWIEYYVGNVLIRVDSKYKGHLKATLLTNGWKFTIGKKKIPSDNVHCFSWS